MTVDNLDKLDWKKYMQAKQKAEELRLEAKKANRLQPVSLESLDEKITKQDFLLVNSLLIFFFDEVANKYFNDFLDDHGYVSEDYVRVMNRHKRLKDKLAK